MTDLSPGNVPRPLTNLVGRKSELEEVCSLMAGSRLVTLAGTGGVGKTRLALAAADRLGPGFADGAWWVDLGAVLDPRLLAMTVGASLEVPQTADLDMETALLAHLGSRAALVVLDNCEQVASECARLVEVLLRGCPDLRVLATSREVIGAPGESVIRLGGLGVVGAGEAVELFVERASAVLPGFARDMNPSRAAAISDLCNALDGLPLAIELAAARVGLLGVEEIAGRLRDDPRILRNPSRHAARRHVTLEATLEWSYRLLTPTEQVVFRRLSVFNGSFSLGAAEKVAFRAGIERGEFLQLLGWLVDKSLVHVDHLDAGRRYRLLETVRYFGYERLKAAFETTSAHEAHLSYYLSFAGEARPALDGPDQLGWLERLDAEHDNLRAALGWADAYDAESLGQLTAQLWPFWYRRGLYAEAREWMERAVAVLEETSFETQAGTLTGAGVLAFLQCDYALAVERLARARDIYEHHGERAGLATVLQRLGSVAREQGDYRAARQLHLASRSLWEALEDPGGVAASDDFLGFVDWLEGDLDGGERQCRRALAHFTAGGGRQEAVAAQVNLGVIAYYRTDPEQATALLEDALAASAAIGYQEGVAWSLQFLGAIEARKGHPEGHHMLRDALSIHAGLRDHWRTASVLETVAALCLVPGDPVAAARLLGAADALRTRLGAPVPPVELPAVEAAVASARSAISPSHFEDAWADGRAAAVEVAVEWALVALRARPEGAAGGQKDGTKLAGDLEGLTPREVDVLRLVQRGLTNREIGRELFISAGTAGVHVSNLLRKLGLTSRVQAAALAERAGLGAWPDGAPGETLSDPG